MKTELLPNLAGCLVVAAFSSLALAQQSSAPEAQPTTSEEWYDPTDWYDAEHSVSERYEDSPFYDQSWDEVNWKKDFDKVFNDDFGVDYSWNVDEGAWQLVYDNDFDFDGSAKQVFGNEALDDPAVIESRDEPVEGLVLPDGQLADDGESDGDEATGGESGNRSSKQSDNGREVETLTGTIADFREIDVGYASGSEQTHALARVELEGGGKAVVDLGLSDLWEGALGSGDKVTFHGAKGVMNGRNVFVASRASAQGETVFINRVLPQTGGGNAGGESSGESSGASNASGKPASRTIEGQVEEIAKVEIDGKDQTLLKVRMQSGRSATVSLGSGPSSGELGLRKGDSLRVEGELKQIDGKNVIAATTISVEGEKIEG